MNSLTDSFKKTVHGTALGRAFMILPRVVTAVRRSGQPLLFVLPWAVASREYTNFSYETTYISTVGLCAMVAAITGANFQSIAVVADELKSNTVLAEHVRADHAESDRKWTSDAQFRSGRHMIYYLLTRTLKPGFVVESGVDKGMGAAVICEAIYRNEREGHAGDYVGIEVNPSQRSSIYIGYRNRRGEIRHGNSPDVIRRIERKIDLFIHDSTADAAHVDEQLEVLQGRMADSGVLVSAWALPQFVAYATRNGKKILMHQEQPDRHWYSGTRWMAVY